MKSIVLVGFVAALTGCGEDTPAPLPDKPRPEFIISVPPLELPSDKLPESPSRPEPTPDPTPARALPTPIPRPTPQATPRATPTPQPTPKPTPNPTPRKSSIPKGVGGSNVVAAALKHAGLNELQGNRGPEIDAWNRAAGVPVGSPYCASFAGAMHREVGFEPPKGYAYTPSWFNSRYNIEWTDAEAGDVLGFYFADKERIAHIAILVEPGPTYSTTIEANTSPAAKAGSATDRDGDGVHKKIRNTYVMRQDKRNKVARYW